MTIECYEPIWAPIDRMELVPGMRVRSVSRSGSIIEGNVFFVDHLMRPFDKDYNRLDFDLTESISALFSYGTLVHPLDRDMPEPKVDSDPYDTQTDFDEYALIDTQGRIVEHMASA